MVISLACVAMCVQHAFVPGYSHLEVPKYCTLPEKALDVLTDLLLLFTFSLAQVRQRLRLVSVLSCSQKRRALVIVHYPTIYGSCIFVRELFQVALECEDVHASHVNFNAGTRSSSPRYAMILLPLCPTF